MPATDPRFSADLRPATPKPAAFSATGPLMPEREAEEVERRHVAFCAEFGSYSESGQTLSRIAAVMSVRAERCGHYENAVLVERARKTLADFVPPSGADAEALRKLRNAAEARAMFDASAEMKEARRYEASAVRTFLRALKELQRIKRDADKAERAAQEAALGSFLQDDKFLAEFEALRPQARVQDPKAPARLPVADDLQEILDRVKRPFSVSRRR